VLCGSFAANLAKPLRHWPRVERFGAGDSHGARQRDAQRRNRRRFTRFDRMRDRISTCYRRAPLATGISHELRSPLARLSFAAELTATRRIAMPPSRD